jgi:hypothetical protein
MFLDHLYVVREFMQSRRDSCDGGKRNEATGRAKSTARAKCHTLWMRSGKLEKRTVVSLWQYAQVAFCRAVQSARGKERGEGVQENDGNCGTMFTHLSHEKR